MNGIAYNVFVFRIMNIHKLTFKIVQIEHDDTFLARLLVQIIEKQSTF